MRGGVDIQQAGTQLIAVYNTMFLMFSQFGKLWPAALEMETTAGLIWVTLVDMPFVVWLVQFIADKLRMPQDPRVVDGAVFVLVFIANALVFGRRGTMQIIKENSGCAHRSPSFG